jgi:glucose/arabinose dehydrogenase/mono/diheme cytochrome c family protein/sugar lactone lactonase YvrE
MRLLRLYRNLLSCAAVIVAFCVVNSMVLAQGSKQLCTSDNSGLKMPAGFCATVFAEGIGHARHIVVAPNGVVYVNTWSGDYYDFDKTHEGGFLVALQDKTGDGKADVIERFGETVQTGGHGGVGIGLYKGSIYAESNDRIVRYSLSGGGIVPQGSSETIVSGLPLGGDHPMHPFIIASDGSMYVDVATATNSCQAKNRQPKIPGDNPCTELETRGGVWRFDANKTDQKFSPAERYATGIRNAEGYAIDSAGHVFATQHGRDQLHTNWPDLYKPSDEATLPAEELVLLKSGGDYGWPECYYDGVQKKLVLAPEYGGDGGKKVGVCAEKIPPVAAFPAHWGPNGMTRYDGKQFPKRYRDGVFIAFHGSWNRAPYPQGGYNIVFQPLAGERASGNCEIFADGFAGAVKSPEGATYRPTGVAAGPDGALYVSDDIKGRIYRIVYTGDPAGPAPATTSCPSTSAPAGDVVQTSANPPEGNIDPATLPVPEGSTSDMVVLGGRIYHGQVGGASCTGCHGANATGTPLGPDLTKNKWLWSDGSFAGILKVITEGVPQPKQYRSPMPPMGGAQLSDTQASAVAAYVWALSHQTKTSTDPAGPAQLLVPGEKIYPESLTSTADARVIIGSIVARTIFVVKPGTATAEVWIQPDSGPTLGVYGVFADEKSNTLWACFSSVPGPHSSPQAPAALKTFDLQTGALKQRYQLPTAGAFCNDIAVGSDGSAYVSDTENMEVDRLPSGGHQLQVWAGNGGFGPKGGILDGISVLGNRVLVNTLVTNKLFSIAIQADGKAGAISEINLDRAIENPDGMRSFGKDSLLIVEGGGQGRLSRINIDGNSGQVTPLKEGYPDGAVAVTVVGTTGYVLEGQLAALFGKPDPQRVAKPFRATAVEVGTP